LVLFVSFVVPLFPSRCSRLSRADPISGTRREQESPTVSCAPPPAFGLWGAASQARLPPDVLHCGVGLASFAAASVRHCRTGARPAARRSQIDGTAGILSQRSQPW
jgi:hypothetical protein